MLHLITAFIILALGVKQVQWHHGVVVGQLLLFEVLPNCDWAVARHLLRGPTKVQVLLLPTESEASMLLSLCPSRLLCSWCRIAWTSHVHHHSQKVWAGYDVLPSPGFGCNRLQFSLHCIQEQQHRSSIHLDVIMWVKGVAMGVVFALWGDWLWWT